MAHVLTVDRFGNAGLNVAHEELAGTRHHAGRDRWRSRSGGERYLATYARTFADVRPGELIVYEDAYRTLAIAINRGDAAATLGLRAGRRGAPAARDDRHGRASTTALHRLDQRAGAGAGRARARRTARS